MKLNPVVFREYDIRGVVGKDFDFEFAENLGRAFITLINDTLGIKNPIVTLGFDARESSPTIIKSLSKGIIESGGSVLHLGLVTSPISYFSTFTIPEVCGAIMVTGSHNPPEYNGFKISIGKSTIFGEEIQKLKVIMSENRYLKGSGTQKEIDIFTPYLKRYKEEFGQIQPIPIVLDCGNGAAGCIARRLYETVGLRPKILFEEPDGTFPNHHPDPTVAENLVDLIAEVKRSKAKVGIGFDGDADRIGVVDETGEIILGDELMALASRFILEKRPGEKIIGDVKCSDRVFDYIQKYGGKPIMWKTGHSLVKEKIKIEKAPFGGELSGHIFFADRNYGYDDALYAGLRVVEILSQTGQTIRQLLSDLPTSFNTPEIRIDTTEEKKHAIVTKLKDVFQSAGSDVKVNLIDGIRVSFPDGWALARASNTQPVLVLRFEANSEMGLKRIRERFESVVNAML